MIFDNRTWRMMVQMDRMCIMTETTKTNTNVILYNVVRITAVSVKPDGDSKVSKKVNVRTTINNVPLNALIADALRTDNIRFQRDLRKRFDTLKVGETLERTYGAKVATVIITEEMARDAYVTKLVNMTPAERDIEIAKLSEKAQAIIDEPIGDDTDEIDDDTT